MHKPVNQVAIVTVVLAAVAAVAPRPAHALEIVYNNTGSVGTEMMGGFEAAAAILQNLVTDNVTVRINVAASSSMSSGILAQTSTARVNYSSAATRAALVGNATSAVDYSSVGHLQTGNSVAMVTNLGSATRTYDNNGSANNTNVLMTTANAKALGLMSDSGSVDATVTFNATYGFDYNTSNGVAGYDFVGIALHELATALGFMSGVDSVDLWTRYGMSTDNMAILSTLDLFRYSSASLAYGPNVIDAAVGGTPYFSVDGGATDDGDFSTGSTFGNGYQASRWAYGSDGIMAPTAGYGQIISLAQKDVDALDAIGWEIAPNQLNGPSPVPPSSDANSSNSGSFSANVAPEPVSSLFFAAGLGFLGLARRRRR
jgi:hypothetical protein